MKYLVDVDVMPLDELLDPQGKVINQSLEKLGMNQIENVRIGKHIRFTVEAADEKTAHDQVEEACKKLLANLIMEKYEITLKAIG